MRCFATILAAVMSSVHLASRILVDTEHRILEANAQKDLPMGNELWRHLKPEPASQIAEPFGHWDNSRPASASPFADPGSATEFGKLYRKNKSPASHAIAAKAELGVAKSVLEEALEASGPNEKGLFVKGFAALSAAQAAMDHTQVAFNRALPVFDNFQGAMDDDELAEGAETLLIAVEAAMENTQAAMDDAQEAFNDLLRAYDAEQATGKAEMQDAQHFQAAIIAAIEALKEARSKWWYDVQLMEALNEQEAGEAEIVAGTESMKQARNAENVMAEGAPDIVAAAEVLDQASMTENVAAIEAADNARMAKIETFADAVDQAATERADKELQEWQKLVHGQTKIWKKVGKQSKIGKKKIREKTQILPVPNHRGLMT